jgi:multidrug transporter EmrE-like cation transporter
MLTKPNLQDTWNDFKTNARGFLIMAGCATLSYFFLLKSYALVEKSIAVPVYSSTAVLVVLMGIIFLKETSNLQRKLLAIVIVFAGLVSLGLS